MKNLIFILSLLFLLSSCNNEDEPDHLELSETNIEFDSREQEKNISIKSTSAWLIQDIPEWCTLSELSGERGKHINLLVKLNETYIGRDAKLKFIGENNTQILSIKQSGIDKDDKDEQWYSFPINNFESVKNTNEGNAIHYTFEANEYFINAWISDKVFIGNIISSNSESNRVITEHKGYHYNPITISSLVGSKFYSDVIDVPTKENIKHFADNVIKERPKQNNKFVISSPLEFYTYRQLYFLSYGNTGEDFCKLITGKTYQETKMVKSIGLIYTYYQEVFDVIMDLPDNLITEDLTEEFINENNLSYVSSMNYGRTAFLIVESDYDKALVKLIIQKVTNEEQLTNYEKNILDKLEVSYLYYTKDSKLIADNTDQESLIRKYRNSMNNNDVIQLNFALNKFNDHSKNTYNYKINIP